jgi:phenylacetate-coenzyme A ligase PaaK-like adenylate-forming protein
MLSNLWRTSRVFSAAMRERRVPYWPVERLRDAQNRRLRRIIRHAYETVPFYRSAMRERNLRPDDFQTVEDLAQLPLIDKGVVQRDASEFRSTGVPLEKCVALHSGGGSLTYWDPEAAIRRLPLAERDRVVWLKAIQRGRDCASCS